MVVMKHDTIREGKHEYKMVTEIVEEEERKKEEER